VLRCASGWESIETKWGLGESRPMIVSELFGSFWATMLLLDWLAVRDYVSGARDIGRDAAGALRSFDGTDCRQTGQNSACRAEGTAVGGSPSG
jgi:hypothetical protein